MLTLTLLFLLTGIEQENQTTPSVRTVVLLYSSLSFVLLADIGEVTPLQLSQNDFKSAVLPVPESPTSTILQTKL